MTWQPVPPGTPIDQPTVQVRPPRSAPPRRRRWLLRLGQVVVSLVVLTVLAGAVAWVSTPSVGDMQVRVANDLATQGLSVSTAPVTGRVATALIATEDSRFYQHPGIDVIALPRIAAALARGQSDLGGATLDQQLVKLLYTPSRGDLAAKLEQVVLALKLDATYSKSQILQAYLTSVYFGHGFYGLVNAAQGYFGLPPNQLSWAQASVLAGLVQAPSAYDPLTQLTLAKQRQHHVLSRLVATGNLTQAQANAAFAAPLNLVAANASATG